MDNRKKRLTQFEVGVLYSAAIIMIQHDEPTLIEDLLSSAGLENADCSSLDEFDKGGLRLLMVNTGKLKLSGLDPK